MTWNKKFLNWFKLCLALRSVPSGKCNVVLILGVSILKVLQNNSQDTSAANISPSSPGFKKLSMTMNMALFGGPFYKFMSASDVKYLMENKLACVSISYLFSPEILWTNYNSPYNCQLLPFTSTNCIYILFFYSEMNRESQTLKPSLKCKIFFSSDDIQEHDHL